MLGEAVKPKKIAAQTGAADLDHGSGTRHRQRLLVVFRFIRRATFFMARCMIGTPLRVKS